MAKSKTLYGTIYTWNHGKIDPSLSAIHGSPQHTLDDIDYVLERDDGVVVHDPQGKVREYFCEKQKLAVLSPMKVMQFMRFPVASVLYRREILVQNLSGMPHILLKSGPLLMRTTDEYIQGRDFQKFMQAVLE